VLAGLIVSRIAYPALEPLLTQAVASLARAADAFENAAMFYSAQFVNVLILGGVLLLSGGALWLISRRQRGAQTFAVLVVAADLMLASWGFNAASDPLLLDFTPPAIEWLRAKDGNSAYETGRYAVLNGEGRDILRPNMTLRYGLDDVRGYDSIISAEYVAYMRAITAQNLLDANQIQSLYPWDDYAAILTSPRFLKLNTRWLITHRAGDLPEALTEWRGWERTLALAYEDEAVRIYEIADAVPRAYLLPDGHPAVNDADAPVERPFTYADISADTGRELTLSVEVDAPSWLIVSQTYAPGWKAYLRPAGAPDDQERELPVERVQEIFQGVALAEPGAWTLRLIYSPPSFQLGVFGTLMSGAVLLLVVGTWLWRGFVLRSGADHVEDPTARLARNSVVPILLNLFNRGIDFVFAFIMFRILGPEDAGFYYYAIVVFGWFDIFTNFGLDVYLMREAGRARPDAPRLFFNTSALRLLLVVIAVPALLGFLLIRQASADPLNSTVLLAIGLFYLGLIPGSLSKGLTSLYYAFERAEYPAAVTTVTTISRVILGVAALVLGYGIVGLAAVSIVTNVVTLIVLWIGARAFLHGLRITRPDRGLMRGMVGGSWPLMLNHFLATIFFQIDIVLLEWIKGARIVGLYRVAYSWLLAINVVPAFFTQALLPIMSRQARDNHAALRRTYTLGIKLLVAVAFPLAVGFTFLAEPLTWFLGGAAYLPDGAIALRIMIWSIPIGWMNSLTQYALVALDLQRRITVAFAVAVAFNVSANLLLIPAYGFQAAALTTIVSEIVLFVPFALLMQSKLGRLPWLAIIARPALAAGVMAGVTLFGWALIHPVFGVAAGVVVYPLALLAFRPLSADEWRLLSPVIPARARRWLPVAALK
ncbi:MAG TPA: flippase, partial [Aggregatilineales bacterium]|nr:flippase [Aggregatilineales bacterium]